MKELNRATGIKHTPEQIVNLLRQIGRTTWKAKTRFGTVEVS